MVFVKGLLQLKGTQTIKKMMADTIVCHFFKGGTITE